MTTLQETSPDRIRAQLPERALIAGCGDIGQRVARCLRDVGREVTAIVRDRQKGEILTAQGIATRLEDLDAPRDVGDWPLLFWFAPPSTRDAGDARLRAWLAAQGGRIARIVYISTPAVYGDCGGRWIDEDEPIAPRSERGLRRADAEAALQDWQRAGHGEVVILRVPGIYGPGRLPLERLRKQLPVVRAAESPYTNRIHADDLAEAALHAAVLGRAGRAYHIADGEPTTMADYFTRCAHLLGFPAPPQVSYEEARRVLTPAMWSFMEESKRLRIERMRLELSFTPRYPNLDAGLPACLAGTESRKKEGVMS